MYKLEEHYYCDRCGKEISKEEHSNYPVKFNDCPVHHVCKDCFEEFEPKRNELLNWLTMDGCALACEGTHA